jgi:hypothetical protein
MPTPHLLILNDPIVSAALRQAWLDSNPGLTGGHEEGGFIIQGAEGKLGVKRWTLGKQDSITVPPHTGCRFENNEIIATFHTHPNTGNDYQQEPSETDKQAVRNDSHLKGEGYVGEFVISAETIFLITPAGRVREIADSQTLLEENQENVWPQF